MDDASLEQVLPTSVGRADDRPTSQLGVLLIVAFLIGALAYLAGYLAAPRLGGFGAEGGRPAWYDVDPMSSSSGSPEAGVELSGMVLNQVYADGDATRGGSARPGTISVRADLQ